MKGIIKKGIIVLCVAAIVLSLSSPAFADEDGGPFAGNAAFSAIPGERFFLYDAFHRFNLKRFLFASNTVDDIEPLSFSDEETVAASEILSGKIIGIDPGHQRFADYGLEPVAPGSKSTKIKQSPGCVGIKSLISEYVINLSVSQKLKCLLESCGATVIMTRDSADVSISNIERASLMNENAVDFWIRVHCNFSSDPSDRGVCVLIPGNKENAECARLCEKLGKHMADAFSESENDVPVLVIDNQSGFNWSQSPVAAVELGYLSNENDDMLLNRDVFQSNCAIRMLRGIMDFLTPPNVAERSADHSEIYRQ